MIRPGTAFLLRFILPAAAAIGLFLAALYGFFLPSFERSQMERKREMIRELGNVAWSTLEHYAEEERSGRLSRDRAQVEARRELRQLRYGPEAKDYYWVIDLQPRMVMHPYVPELEGQDLRQFRDAAGKALFVDQVAATGPTGWAYVEYVWQWKDDAHRQTPKLSFVRRFEPWGWIVGTGLYVEDVRLEIRTLEDRLLRVSGGITLLVGTLLAYLAFQGRRAEQARQGAERELMASEARYRTLVRASNEGLLMLQEGQPPFSNRHLAFLLGRSREELATLPPERILEALEVPTAEPLLPWLEGLGQPRELRLRRADGGVLPALVSASRERIGEGEALVVTVRDISQHRAVLEALDRSREWFRDLVERLGLGVVRAEAGRQWRLLDANPAALRLLGLGAEQLGQVDLGGLFRQRSEWERLREDLERDGSVRERIVELGLPEGPGTGVNPSAVTLSLSLVMVQEGPGESILEGLVEEVGAVLRASRQRDRLLADLQFGQLVRYQPLKPHLGPLTTLRLDTSIAQAARHMTRDGRGAAVVLSEGGLPCGVVTDTDLRSRALAEGLEPETPVLRIMSAPLVSLPENALLVEALQVMERRHISHLVATDASGRLSGMLEAHHLLAAHQALGEGLLQELRSARDPETLAQALQRLPALVKALRDSGIHARHLARFLTSLADAAAGVALAHAERQMGPPPRPYALLAFGSQARGEMLPGSDQDQGLIYAEDDPPTEEATVEAYFLELGKRVSSTLAQGGYALCPGGVMAGQPAWTGPISRWKRQFSKWVGAAEPKDLLDVHICFDLRRVQGDEALVRELETHVRQAVAQSPTFLFHLASGALQSRPTLSKLGAIQTESGERVDLKHASAKLVNAVRILALKADLGPGGTLDRLEALQRIQPREPEAQASLEAAFELLLSLRLEAQLIGQGNQPDLRRLTEQDRAALKKSLQQVEFLCSRLSFEVLGRS